MTTNDLNQPPPTADLHQFLKELPKPFREQLLIKLFAFFKDEIFVLYDGSPDEILQGLVEPPGCFQRAILLIGALDYLFSQKVPWPPDQDDDELMKAAGMHPMKAAYPIRDEPYLEARAKWKTLRSKYSNSALRKLEQAHLEP